MIEPQPKKEIVLKDFTRAELAKFNGCPGPDGVETPIYIAVRGDVYDASSAKHLYGPGAGYNIFAGHDASYALGTFSLEPENVDKPIDNLTASELDQLMEWKQTYDTKYILVGRLVD
eukprot:CAMPEP_0117046548 /NCGR_PEP_ID=MMETSP0472-20121206/32182_1 /TAXON_ID=693140 ORGANISM="Tiarina fusus, Strain LIS" /NCGR_SAMPLE_ID=MMETSP0472 /ASSEMBLY_ACC=CAM_ASM_000603 /LENGTH=116 /DNA_ID=CAMNT_0004758935 /DNA_START=109 /DNA_END=459 /DNA_ORIENTATION=+